MQAYKLYKLKQFQGNLQYDLAIIVIYLYNTKIKNFIYYKI